LLGKTQAAQDTQEERTANPCRRPNKGNAYRMKYKTMYEEGDIDGMADLERDLYSLGIGFSVSDFENWLK